MPDPQSTSMSSLDLDPEAVSNLLHMEAQGQVPEQFKAHIERARSMGILPPPLPGGSALWGSTLQSGKPTSGYQPAIPPAPKLGPIDSAMAEVPGALNAAKTGMKATGKAFLDNALDPEVLGATVGGLGGTATGIPGAGIVGAGLGSGVVAGVREHFNAQKENRPESITPAASAAITGAAGEGAGNLLPKMFSSEMTPMGAKTVKALGDKAMIPDLVQSPGWDFARNVAREGFLGRGGMLQRETENAGTMLNKVTTRAERELPKPPGMGAHPQLNPDKSMAGREAQDALRTNFVDQTAQGKDLYKNFMAQHGKDEIIPGKVDPLTGNKGPGVTLKTLHERRSAALEGSREAAANNDYVGQMKAMKTVHAISDKIEQAAPATAKDYNAISDQYGKTMEQYDNPVVRNLREKVPAENLVDVMLHPDSLKTFAPFRENSTVPGRSIPAHQSVSQEDAVHMVRMAVGEDKFRQLRADTIMQMGQAAKSDEFGGTVDGLQGRELVKQLQKIPGNVQSALFGPGTSQALNEIADVTAHTQRTRSGTGALWIVMRQPSEMLKVGGQIAGMATAAGAGYKTGHEDLGLTAAGAILLSPLVLSSILRSPTATKLFVRAIGSQPTIKAQILQRLATQIPAEALRESYVNSGSAPASTIPNPPER